MAFAYAGPTNAYLPTLELSGNLQIGYSRNRNSYAINRWTRFRNCQRTHGLYRQFNPLDYNRIKSGNARQFIWAPGTASPGGQDGSVGFQNVQYNCDRRAYPCDLDLLTDQQADYDIAKDATENAANLAMVVRTLEATNVIVTSGNHIASHVYTATAAAGGFLSGATEADPRIKKALQYGTLRILRDSNTTVKPSQIVAVMNPNTAQLLSQTQEMHSVFARSRFAQGLVTGDLTDDYGLSSHLYTHPIVVEDATYNLFAREDAVTPEAQAFVFPDNTIALVTVTGDEDNKGLPANTRNISSLNFFVYGPDDMKVETETNTYDRILRMKVVDNFDVQLTAPVTAALITNVFS